MGSSQRSGRWMRLGLCLGLGLVMAACGGSAADETGSPSADETGSPSADETGSTAADETGSAAADETEAAPTTVGITATAEPTTTTTTAEPTTTRAPVTVLTADGERPAIDILEEYFAAIRAGDMARVTEMSLPGLQRDLFWVEYQSALGIEPELSDCSALPASEASATVVCQTTAGDDYFYTRIAGQPLFSSIRASVTAEGLDAAQWPWYSAPESSSENTSLAIEGDFRAWVQAVYPELEDDLYTSGGESFDGIATNRESGELRVQLLDEYLTSRP